MGSDILQGMSLTMPGLGGGPQPGGGMGGMSQPGGGSPTPGGGAAGTQGIDPKQFLVGLLSGALKLPGGQPGGQPGGAQPGGKPGAGGPPNLFSGGGGQGQPGNNPVRVLPGGQLAGGKGDTNPLAMMNPNGPQANPAAPKPGQPGYQMPAAMGPTLPKPGQPGYQMPAAMGPNQPVTPLPPPRPPGPVTAPPVPPPSPSAPGNTPLPPPRPPGMGTTNAPLAMGPQTSPEAQKGQAAFDGATAPPTPPTAPARPPLGVPQPGEAAALAKSGWRNPIAAGVPGTSPAPVTPANLSDKPATPLPARPSTGSGSGPASPASSAPAAPTTGGYRSQAPGTIGAVDTTLRNGGFSANAVAGIMGNINQESNFDSRLGTIGGDAGASHGLGQWNGARLTDLKNFAARNKLNPDDPVTQAKFMINEADRRSPGLTARMNAAKSPAEAARIWSDVYESPKKGPTENMSGRQSYAENFAKGHYGKPGLMNRGGGGGTAPSGTDTPVASDTPTRPEVGDKPTFQAKKSDAQQPAEQKKKQQQAGGGKFDITEAKNYVEVSQLAKPVENILAQRVQQETAQRYAKAHQDQSSTLSDLFESA